MLITPKLWQPKLDQSVTEESNVGQLQPVSKLLFRNKILPKNVALTKKLSTKSKSDRNHKKTYRVGTCTYKNKVKYCLWD